MWKIGEEVFIVVNKLRRSEPILCNIILRAFKTRHLGRGLLFPGLARDRHGACPQRCARFGVGLLLRNFQKASPSSTPLGQTVSTSIPTGCTGCPPWPLMVALLVLFLGLGFETTSCPAKSFAFHREFVTEPRHPASRRLNSQFSSTR